RTLENIIKEANLLIPALAFGTAAYLTAHTERATLLAMSSFIGYFALLTLILCTLSLATIAARARLPFLHVLAALKEPLVVGFTSGSEMAPIPHTIEAMSTRLGFSRGVVELVVPLGAVFLRAGSALYFALVAIFVSNLYERPLDAIDLVLIGVAASAAAFASSGRSGVATVGFSAMVLAVLQLPIEAAGVLFVAIDLLCEGPRNVLSMLSGCTVIALVSAGLPSERFAGAEPQLAPPALRPVLQFAFSRTQLALASGCLLTVASLIVLMGIGVGAR
ncbi:MAG TPA: cation:dicarboxylase symporter family transporter, partial [Paraburkholderia sp.]